LGQLDAGNYVGEFLVEKVVRAAECA
jgi:hypothetical protein